MRRVSFLNSMQRMPFFGDFFSFRFGRGFFVVFLCRSRFSVLFRRSPLSCHPAMRRCPPLACSEALWQERGERRNNTENRERQRKTTKKPRPNRNEKKSPKKGIRCMELRKLTLRIYSPVQPGGRSIRPRAAPFFSSPAAPLRAREKAHPPCPSLRENTRPPSASSARSAPRCLRPPGL